MNLLFIGAHPDDLEILCGGTIARCVAQGHHVTMAVATNGNVGSPDLTREEIAAIREREARTAAEALGAHHFIWMNQDDERLGDGDAVRLLFIDAMREARADVVIAHHPGDYHPDHLAVSRCATDARIISSVRLIETAHPHLPTAPDLYYMDTIAGIGFEPQFHVDISAFYAKKEASVAAHHSQNAWLKAIFGTDLMHTVKVQSAFRGLQAGVPYAEAFTQPQYWPKRGLSLPFLM